MKKLFLILLSLTPAVSAQARPMSLFVNMNYAGGNYCSPSEAARGCVPHAGEMATLQKNAIALGVSRQDMLVVPPPELTREYSRLDRESDNIRYSLHLLNPALKGEALKNAVSDIKEKGAAGITDPVVLQRLKGDSRASAAARAALSEKNLARLQAAFADFKQKERAIGPIDQQIRRALETVKARGGNLDMLSVSGHSVGNEIYGESGYKLFPSQVRALIKDHPELVKEPRRIALPGCYTYTSQEFDRWQNDLGVRKDSLVVGWDGTGRTRKDKIEWKYLDETFTTANRLDRILAERRGKPLALATVRKSFMVLDSVRQSNNAALSYCGYYFNHSPTGEERESCDDQWANLQERADDIEERYLTREKVPEEEPPENTTISPLRKFYSKLQKMCTRPTRDFLSAEDLAEEKAMWTDLRDRSVRTIFWRNVRSNFARCQAKEIDRVRDTAHAAGLPELALSAESGRKGFLRSYLELKAAAEKRKDSQARAVLESLKAVEPLVNLDATIPLPWTDPTNPRCD